MGGGFAGAYVARLLGKRGATIVNPDNFMLYTPLLPEAAARILEPRHVVVPLRTMCTHAELLLGRVLARDPERKLVVAETLGGRVQESAFGASSSRSDAVPQEHTPSPAWPSTARASRTSPTRSRSATRLLRALESAAARARSGRGGTRSRLRLRRRGLPGRRSAGRAPRPRPGTPPPSSRLYAAPAQRWVLVDTACHGSYRRSRASSGSTRRQRARGPRGRDPRRHDPGVDSTGATPCSRKTETRVPARNARRDRRRASAARSCSTLHLPLDRAPSARQSSGRRSVVENPRRRVVARRLRGRSPNTKTPGAFRPAHLPARAPAGPEAREEPRRRAGTPYGYRMLGGLSRRSAATRKTPASLPGIRLRGFPGLVGGPDVPPLRS